MPVHIFLLVAFILAAIYGAWQSVRGIRKLRLSRPYKDARMTWSERSAPGYEYELLAWISTSIHWLSVVIIGAIMLVMILFAAFDASSLSSFSPCSVCFLLPLAGAACAAAGSIWGAQLFGPIAEMMGGRRNYALNSEGLYFGGRQFPWQVFSHLSVEAERRLIYLWSASMPETTAFALVQDTQQQFEALRSTLQEYLPSGDPPSAGTLRQYVLPLIMLVVSLPFVVIALLMILAPFLIALLVDCALMFILMLAGGQLLMRLVYGGKVRPAAVE